MGKFYDDIPESHFEWIKKQHMFWVATAPLINSKQVWYEDLTGTGVETISHVRENSRITVMFCAFEGPPRILRLFGIGTVHEYGSPEYGRLIPTTCRKPGSRAAIIIDVYQVGTSCGYAVPLYDFVMHRTQLHRIANKAEDGDRALAAARDREHGSGGDAPSQPQLSLRMYWLLKNMRSLDGLPGLLTAPDGILDMTPQNNFDKNSLRPMLRRSTQVSDIAQDRRWFAFGFVLGTITTLAVIMLCGRLKESHVRFLSYRLSQILTSASG